MIMTILLECKALYEAFSPPNAVIRSLRCIFHNYIPSDGIHDKISDFYVPISDGCPLTYAIMVKFWENIHALIQFQSMQLTRHILISVEQ